MGDGETYGSRTNLLTVVNPLNYPVVVWHSIDGVRIEEGSLGPGETAVFPILTQDGGHDVRAGYDDPRATTEWSLDNGWVVTNRPVAVTQTWATNSPDGWQNYGTNAWTGQGGTQPWRTLTNSTWSPIDWSSMGTPGALAASDYTLRAGFNGIINSQRESDGQLLLAQGLGLQMLGQINQGVTNIGPMGTNIINITNLASTNTLDWTEGASNWTARAANVLGATNGDDWLAATADARGEAAGGAGPAWSGGQLEQVGGFAGQEGSWGWDFPVKGGQVISLKSTDAAVATLGSLCRQLLSWLWAFGLFWMNWRYLETWYHLALLAPQGTTAGTEVLGTNVNAGSAFGMAIAICAVVWTLPVFGLILVNTTFGGAGSGYAGLIFPSLGDAGKVLTTFVPLAVIGLGIADHLLLRVTLNVAGGTAMGLIRCLTGV